MVTILITGATGGIGSKLSEMLAKEKNSLILLATKSDALEKLSKELKEAYAISVITIQCDVSNYDDAKNKLSKITEIDVVVNCAGIAGPTGLIEDNDMAEWNKAIQVNLLGTVHVCNILIPILKNSKKSRRGKIINFAGGGSAYARKLHTAYACSKTAVVRFTETIAQEHPELDINVIAPGAHKTKIWDEQLHESEPEKWGDMDRLKDLIVYLSNEKSDGLSGKFIHIYDDWDKKDFRLADSDFYTLRRIDDRFIQKFVDKQHQSK